jgi:hypothetical protein
MFNTQSNNVAGYCKHHRCGMTVKQIKCKNCLQKQCWYFVKNEQHAWWKQREDTKQKRKERKQRMNTYAI